MPPRMPPMSRYQGSTPNTGGAPQTHAMKALTGASDSDTDLLPGERNRAVRPKPPIQGNEATTTTQAPNHVGPAQGKGGQAIPPEEPWTPPLGPTQPTAPPSTPQTPPPTPAKPKAPNDIVIRQWNLNRGINNNQMRWDPATNTLFMDNRPVFQVGRNMRIDAQGNGVTDEETWRQEMQRYGYGEQANSNIPDYQRRLLTGAESTLDPNMYWATALGQSELQNIRKNRDKAMVDARTMLGARGASMNGSTAARMFGNVVGTEQQALVDAAPKLMDAARRSYLDVLNSDSAARTSANAQEIAEAGQTGMFRGNMTYPAQKDYIQGVLDIAQERETMPGMDTSMLNHPGLNALGGQVNDIAGQERWKVTDPREARLVQSEGQKMAHDRALKESKSKDWTPSQNGLHGLVMEWLKDPTNKVSLDKAGYERAVKEFGGAKGVTPQEAMAVIKEIFEGASSGSGGGTSLAEEKVDGIFGLTQYALPYIEGRDRSNEQARAKIWTEIQPKIRKLYEDGKPFGPLTLLEAEEMLRQMIELSDKYADSKVLVETLIRNAQPGGVK